MAGAGKTPSSAVLRLMSDLRSISSDPPEGVSASPVSNENLFVWIASIMGPEDSPWEGGIYPLKLIFPDRYPDKPPKVRFTSTMFHPNVFPDGTLCLDIIQDHWSPVYTVSSILTSVMSLLSDPNLSSPANQDAARLFASNPKEYRRKVRAIAEKSVEQ